MLTNVSRGIASQEQEDSVDISVAEGILVETLAPGLGLRQMGFKREGGRLPD